MKIWHRQVIRYGFVGILSTFAYMAIAMLLVYFFDTSLLVANIYAAFVPMLISYFGNAVWSFETRSEMRTFGKFCCVALFTLVVMVVGSRWISQAGLPPYLGIVIIGVSLPVVSFLLQKLWVFER